MSRQQEELGWEALRDLVITSAIPDRAEVDTLRRLLAIREGELMRLKGPCYAAQVLGCRLHYAHSGPCDTRESR